MSDDAISPRYALKPRPDRRRHPHHGVALGSARRASWVQVDQAAGEVALEQCQAAQDSRAPGGVETKQGLKRQCLAIDGMPEGSRFLGLEDPPSRLAVTY
jgi:hypothetical protein